MPGTRDNRTGRIHNGYSPVKAAVYTQYGPPDVMHITEVDKPEPGDHEVLIKVHASTVSAPDWRMRGADPWITRLFNGLFRPKRKILGYEFAGVVESTGSGVTRFKAGDAVFGWNISGGVIQFGAYAEYLCMPETGMMLPKPEGVSFEAAAVLPSGAITALVNLRKLKLHAGQTILINGASGSIGTYAVQLAKNSGAEVTGVCSTSNVELVKSLGADTVIDYTVEDFTGNGRTYDFIFDTVGKSSFLLCRNSLTTHGAYLSTGLGSFIQNLCFALWTSLSDGKQAMLGRVEKPKLEQLEYLMGLVTEGKLKPVIDRCYPLEQIVEAHRYVEQGHKKGNVVISLV